MQIDLENPCCCVSLPTGAYLVGLGEIAVWSFLFLMDGISASLSVLDNPNIVEAMTHSIIRIALGIILVLGIRKSSRAYLKSWLDIELLLLVWSVMYTIAHIFQGSAFGSIFLRCLLHFLVIYCLIVVYFYYKELKDSVVSIVSKSKTIVLSSIKSKTPV